MIKNLILLNKLIIILDNCTLVNYVYTIIIVRQAAINIKTC